MATAEELGGLREIPLPPPISYASQTIGWLVVAALLLATLGWAMWRRHRRWVADRYRRTALGELDAIGALSRTPRRRSPRW